jgi:hypothetical protein
LSLIF